MCFILLSDIVVEMVKSIKARNVSKRGSLMAPLRRKFQKVMMMC